MADAKLTRKHQFSSTLAREFTGALAGYTFALQNTRLVAMTGLITGVAASLSIAASEYLID